MAEEGSSASGNSDGRNFSAVVSLLRQAESLLSSQLDSNAATVSPTRVETSANSISTGRALANFWSLFTRYSGPSLSPAASLGQARALSTPPKRKKSSVPFVVKETGTHEFFCFS